MLDGKGGSELFLLKSVNGGGSFQRITTGIPDGFETNGIISDHLSISRSDKLYLTWIRPNENYKEGQDSSSTKTTGAILFQSVDTKSNNFNDTDSGKPLNISDIGGHGMNYNTTGISLSGLQLSISSDDNGKVYILWMNNTMRLQSGLALPYLQQLYVASSIDDGKSFESIVNLRDIAIVPEFASSALGMIVLGVASVIVLSKLVAIRKQ